MDSSLRSWLVDTGERVGSTFAEAFLTLIVANQTNAFSLDVLRAAALAGAVAAAAVVKAAVAKRLGRKDSAALVGDRGYTLIEVGVFLLLAAVAVVLLLRYLG